ncbi:MAG: hypothetical protein ACP5IE_08205 [Infirmifilum sp.]|uniref:Uncharacterized protein n=1 Tax=Infirmifilum uzonense TaxID=1550241 RepID=A0A0F7FFX2_9CREN|nr:hypothetical protein [Infirmifilum uzonense]AKG38062.1 hypothetical protein MA03_00445 [Infirmifilum uzonense]
MIREQLQVSGSKAEIILACLERSQGSGLQELIRWVKENTSEGLWLILTNDCCKLPSWKVLKTGLLYSIKNYLENKMISRTLVLELLLYLIGDRNIKNLQGFFFEGNSKQIGLIGISLKGETVLYDTFKRFREAHQLEEASYDEDCWVPVYSDFLKAPADKDVLTKILRARAALLELSA